MINKERKIIDWKRVSDVVPRVGINGEQCENVSNYEPIFDDEPKKLFDNFMLDNDRNHQCKEFPTDERIDIIKKALAELEAIKKRAEEERVKAMGFIEDYKHLNDIATCQGETEYNNRHIHKLTDDLALIDFIIKGEGK